ncbi:MAG: hypothetical protein Q9198_009364, partial [Flavoplaca austrocitrina]
SEKQFEAHERSKKHVKAAQQVRREMELDDKSLNLEKEQRREEGSTSPSRTPPLELTEEEATTQGLEAEMETLSVQDHVRTCPTDDARPSEQNDDSTLNRHSGTAPEDASSSSSDDEYAERDAIEQRILGRHTDCEDNVGNADFDGDLDGSTLGTVTPRSDNDADLLAQPKVGKAKVKRAKKAAQQSAGSGSADAEVNQIPFPC